MTTEEKRQRLVDICSVHNVDCDECPYDCRYCSEYSKAGAPDDIIDKWYELVFGIGDVCKPEQPTDTTYKHDDGKLRIDLVTPNIIEQITKVRTFGVSKYGDNDGWKKVKVKRYEAALLRHLNEYRKGNLIDEESGLPHLAHVACNLMFIMDLEGEDDKRRARTDILP